MRRRVISPHRNQGGKSRRHQILPLYRDRLKLMWLRSVSFVQWKLIALSLLSAVSGGAESLVAALFVMLFAAISSSESTVSVNHSIGSIPISVSLSTGLALWLCLAAVLLRGVLQSACTYISSNVVTSYEAHQRRQLFGAFLETSWNLQSRERLGRLQSLMTDSIGQSRQAIKAVSNGMNAACNFAMLLASALLINWIAAASAAIAAVGLFVLIRPLSKYARAYANRKKSLNLSYSASVNEATLLARELRAFNAGRHVRSKVDATIGKIRRSRTVAEMISGMVPILYQNVAGLMIVCGLAVFSYWELGKMSSLALVGILMIRALSYSQSFQTVIHQISESRPFVAQIEDAKREFSENREHWGEMELGQIQSLSAERIDFSYDRGSPVLKGISLSFSRGEVVGIAGPSGSGKSTLSQILLRLRQPDHGIIEINGVPYSQFSMESWCRRVSYVPQDCDLLNGTIEDNIRFYRDYISDIDVLMSAQLAGIDDEIRTLPLGYQTKVGRGSAMLSGGQRQRICIARALVGRPDLIILDEPTSALDAHSEAKVQSTISRLRGDVLLILIAHRVSTLKICDRIVVLREGKVSAVDTFDSLLADDAYIKEVLQLSSVD